MLIFSFDWPPTINHVYWHTKGRGKVITDKGRDYRAHVYAQAYGGYTRFKTGELVSVTIDAYPPDHRRRDIENISKFLIDCLQAAKIFENDFQVAKLTIERKFVEPPGRVIVTISEYTQEQL